MLHNLPCMDNFFSSFNHFVKRLLILFVSKIGDCSSYPLYRSQRLSRERSTPLQRSLHSFWTSGICTLLLSSRIFVYTVSRECTDSILQVHIMVFSPFKEMALLSGVLARCAWIDVNDANVYSAEVSAHLNRVQRQLLSLISHFGSADSALKKTSNTRDGQFVLEAHVNTILFARNFISKGSSTSRLIFAPSVAEAISKGDGRGISMFCVLSFSLLDFTNLFGICICLLVTQHSYKYANTINTFLRFSVESSILSFGENVLTNIRFH